MAETIKQQADRTIKQQVNQVVLRVQDAERPFLLSFTSLLDERLLNAEKSAVKGLFYFGATWASAYLVSKGLVDQVVEGGLKLKQVQDLLILVPVILGFVSYVLSAALASAMVLEEVVTELYCAVLPGLGETRLHTLFLSHSPLLGAEQHDVLAMRSRFEALLRNVVLYGFILAVFVIPPVAVVHVAFLAEQLHRWPQLLVLLFGAIGCFFWLRGASMVWHAFWHRPA